MIIGIGNDICSVDRIRKIEKKYGKTFLGKFLSAQEIALSEKKDFYPFISGRFAAKEAIQKAVSSKTVEFSSVSVLNDINGKPYIENERQFIEKYGLPASAKIHVTISHEKEFAAATVIIEDSE